MTKDQIKEAIEQMDCMHEKEASVLAGIILEAANGTEEKRQAATTVINFLYNADRITMANKLDMIDLFF